MYAVRHSFAWGEPPELRQREFHTGPKIGSSIPRVAASHASIQYVAYVCMCTRESASLSFLAILRRDCSGKGQQMTWFQLFPVCIFSLNLEVARFLSRLFPFL